MIISFILEPFVRALVTLRVPRAASSLIVCLAAALVLYSIGLSVYTQTSGLMAQMPLISERIRAIAENVRVKVEGFQNATYQIIARQPPPQPPPRPAPTSKRKMSQPPPQGPPPIQEVRIHQDSNPIADYIYARLSTVYEFLLMASFVPFLVYFMLSWGDHVNRTFLQFFQGEDRVIAAKSLQGIGDMVRAFVVGNFVLGVLLALASTICFWLVNVPFPMLAGPLSGFLSLIPYVGLPLALAPPVLAAIGGSEAVGSIVIILVVVTSLHLLALNVFYPKIVGARVHLNPLVVTFAIMFWSFFWDAAGLLLAIPITAGIKAVCDNVRELRPYGRFLGD